MCDWGYLCCSTCRSGSPVFCGWCWGQWGTPPQCSTEGSPADLLAMRMPWLPLWTNMVYMNEVRLSPERNKRLSCVWWLTQCKKLIDAVDDSLTVFISRVCPPFSFLRPVKKSLQLLLCHLHAITNLFWQRSWWSHRMCQKMKPYLFNCSIHTEH